MSGVGQTFVALSLAEICHVLPLSGAQYDWACTLARSKLPQRSTDAMPRCARTAVDEEELVILYGLDGMRRMGVAVCRCCVFDAVTSHRVSQPEVDRPDN